MTWCYDNMTSVLMTVIYGKSSHDSDICWVSLWQWWQWYIWHCPYDNDISQWYFVLILWCMTVIFYAPDRDVWKHYFMLMNGNDILWCMVVIFWQYDSDAYDCDDNSMIWPWYCLRQRYMLLWVLSKVLWRACECPFDIRPLPSHEDLVWSRVGPRRSNVTVVERLVSHYCTLYCSWTSNEYLRRRRIDSEFSPLWSFALVFDLNPGISIVYAFLLMFLTVPLHCLCWCSFYIIAYDNMGWM